MNLRPANDEIVLVYGGITIALRPSLQAATFLERLHDGFPALLQKLKEFDTATIRQLILISTTDKIEAKHLLNYASLRPLTDFIQAVHGAAIDLFATLMITHAEKETKGASTGTTQSWATVYSELYRIATGWLGWTPETAWQATPREITEAFTGHLAKLTAIHGGTDSQDNGNPDEQRQSNVDQGLDPEFDRAGLRALKELSTKREGEVI